MGRNGRLQNDTASSDSSSALDGVESFDLSEDAKAIQVDA